MLLDSTSLVEVYEKEDNKEDNNEIILALDIDDCIFPSEQTYFGKTEDSLLMLEINLKRIVLMLEKYNMKVFISSSWYSILSIENNKLLLLREIMEDKEYYKLERDAFNLLKKYLESYIIGLSCGNRERDIETLLRDGNTVIAFDDIDLSSIKHKKYLFVYVKGFVDGNVTFRVNNFIEKGI